MSFGTTKLFITLNAVTLPGKLALLSLMIIFEPGGSRILNPSRQELISGDVERSISTSDPLKGDEYFREIYLRECDRLAETLYVPNYRRPEVRRYAFERAGAEFIMAVPGPADTAVGSRIALNNMWR